MELTDPLEYLEEAKKAAPKPVAPVSAKERYAKLRENLPRVTESRKREQLKEVDEFIVYLEALQTKYKDNPNIERNLEVVISHYKDNRLKAVYPIPML